MHHPELALQELEDKDLETIRHWLGRPHVKAWYTETEDWIEELEHREDRFSFIHHFLVRLGDKPIGFCQYYRCADSEESCYAICGQQGTYSIDYMIGEEDFLGKGHGKGIVAAIVSQVFALDDAEMILVQPEQENHASCKVLESNGFVFDKKHRLYLKSRAMHQDRAACINAD